MSKLRLANLFQFVFLLVFQLLIMRNLSLYNVGYCYVYIGFLLFLPINTPVVLQIVLGFIAGLLIDIPSDTLGVHTGACVFLAYVRPLVIRLLTPRDGYEPSDTPNIHRMGIAWFLPFAFLLVLLHHTALFVLQIGSFAEWWFTLSRILLSTLYTFAVLVILQLLFFPVRRKR